MQLLKDKTGKDSSKRMAGFCILLLILACTVIGMLLHYPDIASILWPLCSLCGALLGVTVLEKKEWDGK